MKKIISMILSVLILLGMVTVTNAAVTTTASDITIVPSSKISDDGLSVEQTIVINGTVKTDSPEKDKFVNLRIWQPGQSSYTPGNELTAFAVLLQTKADENGAFKFEFPFSYPVNTYEVDIKVEGQAIIDTLTVTTADITPVNTFLTKINNIGDLNTISANLESANTSDFDSLVNNESYYDNADVSVYTDLASAGKLAALKAMVADFKATVNDGDASTKNTTAAVRQALDKNTAIAIFSSTNDAATLKKAYNLYSSAYNKLFDLSSAPGIKALYDGFTEDNKGVVLSAIGNKPYTGIQSVIDAFKENIFLKALKDTTYTTDIATVIDNNIDDYLNLVAGEELSAKNSYKSDSAVKTFVCDIINTQKTSLTTISDFKTAFVNGVNAYVPPTQGGDNFGGGGGGGASSSVNVGTSLLPSNSATPIVASFSDMTDHWASSAVYYLAGKRIVSGRGDNQFYPSDSVTRAEYVKMVVEAYGLYDSNATADFTDVTPDQWYYKYIASMVKKGYVLGSEAGTFNPNALISRQDMAVILYRVLQGENLVKVINTLEVKFDDFNDVSPYAQNCVSYMSNMKLINGSDGKYRPHDSSTRAEAAQIVYNALMGVGN